LIEGESMMENKIRVLVSKIGLDGHDRGSKVIAYALRDAGFEVIYLGIRQTPEKIVSTAIHEDVQVIGLSILSGAHVALTRRVMDKLKEEGVEGVIVLVGGVIPEADIPVLKDLGVTEVFTSGTDISEIVSVINQHAGASA
jgi:methylmalonyl-CoA mutase C-terminal domain/subunit